MKTILLLIGLFLITTGISARSKTYSISDFDVDGPIHLFRNWFDRNQAR
jgi:hypothetical protein